jgi:hypothetical protein
MNASGTVAVQAANRLRGALELAADALASPRLDTLLACEAAIEEALSDLPPLDHLTQSERALVRGELDRARAALLRCRRLGSSLGDFIRLSFEAQGRAHGYGGGDELAFAGRALNERV